MSYQWSGLGWGREMYSPAPGYPYVSPWAPSPLDNSIGVTSDQLIADCDAFNAFAVTVSDPAAAAAVIAGIPVTNDARQCDGWNTLNALAGASEGGQGATYTPSQLADVLRTMGGTYAQQARARLAQNPFEVLGIQGPSSAVLARAQAEAQRENLASSGGSAPAAVLPAAVAPPAGPQVVSSTPGANVGGTGANVGAPSGGLTPAVSTGFDLSQVPLWAWLAAGGLALYLLMPKGGR